MKSQNGTALTALLAAIAGGDAFAEDSVTLDPIEIVQEETAAEGKVEISPETIERRAPTDMRSLLAGESAVTVGGGSVAAANKTFVHGLEETQLNVTVDGARQSGGAFHHSGNVLLDPAILQAVEVYPGVAPADAGPQALGGVIRFETKDARDLLAPGQAYGGYVRASYNSNGSWIDGSTAFAAQSGGFELMAYTRGVDGDDYEDGSGTEIAGTSPGFSSGLFKAAYSARTGERAEFSVSIDRDAVKRQTRPNFGGLVGAPAVLDFYRMDRESAVFSYRDETPTGWLNPEVELAWNRSAMKNFERKSQIESFNGKVQNVFPIPMGTITGGVDFFIDEATGGPMPHSYSESSSDIGLFAQARMTPIERLALSFGGRADQQWFTGVDGSDFSSAGLSGNASAEYAVLDWLSVDAGYSHVWGGYELGESAIYNNFAPWTYDGMSPSSSNSYRLGVSVAHRGFAAGAGLFRTDVDDAPILNSGARGDSVDLKTQGVDANIGYAFARGFARLNYSFVDLTQNGETPGTTNDYLGIPVGHIFGIEAAYEVIDGLLLGANAEITLDNDDTVGLTGGRGTVMHGLDGYQVFNIYADWTPTFMPTLNLRAEVRNLLDATYIARTSNGGGQDDLIVPLNEPGRSFLVTATLAF